METDLIAKVQVNTCISGKVYQFITELEEASCLTLSTDRGDATFNGPKSTLSGVRICHHKCQEKIARLQNASQSTSHWVSRFQFVLTVRFFLNFEFSIVRFFFLVLSELDFLSYFTIKVLEFCHNLGFEFKTIQVLSVLLFKLLVLLLLELFVLVLVLILKFLSLVTI